jgi:hypothetical protein
MNDEKRATPLAQVQAGSIPVPISTNQALSAFTSLNGFELAQRMAKGLMTADLIPQRYQKSIGNTMIAINMAQRLNCDPLMIMQNLYVVHGTPAWSGQFVIAAINQSGMFQGPLRFIESGTKGSDSWGFHAEATAKDDHVIVGPTVTIGLAKAEGWYGKSGSKWQTMPEMMLRYRAGSWFGRTECPEILMGFQSEQEVYDSIDVDPLTGEVLEQAYHTAKEPKTVEVLQTTAAEEVPPETVNPVPVKTAKPDPKPEPEPDSPPDHMPGPTTLEQLEDRGWYEDGNRKFNMHGEIWTEKAHATGRDGNPIINSDGHYRIRRGGALPGTVVETAVEEGTVVENVSKENPSAPMPNATGYEPEPEFIDGPDDDGQEDWAGGLE